MKWRIAKIGVFPSEKWDRIMFLIKAFVDPFVASSIVAAFLGSLTWMAAISKIPLNVGFPIYYGLTFALVVISSLVFLNEPISSIKLIGIILILVGVIIGSLG